MAGRLIHIRNEVKVLDRYLLKNIIILILALVNICLLGSLAMRQSSATDARRQTEAQLTELFAADGRTLEKGASSSNTPPAPLTLTRSTQLEREMAVFFLGRNVRQEDQGGGTYTYTGDSGVARFRAGGTFEIAGSLSSGDVEAFCRKFCQTFSYEPVVLELNSTGSGTGTTVASYLDLPVFNASVTFTVDQGTLLTVSGTLLSEDGAAVSGEQELLSAAAALTAFQSARRESGAVVSAVTETALCYELQSSSLSLTPAWRVATDTRDYYVNCVTGTVTAG